MKTLSGFVFVFVLGFLPFSEASASPAVWVSGFENGFADWTSASGNWTTVSSSLAKSGSRYGKVEGATAFGGDTLLLEISTLGKQNLRLSYWYSVKLGLEADDSVALEWSSDGSLWQGLVTYTDLSTEDVWKQVYFDLPVGASDNSQFAFRLVANLGSASDRMHFDDLTLSEVPEPASLLLTLGFGALFLLGMRRRV
jgi:hypothetical protein